MNSTPDQASAIDSEGEILVLAGAGTGKTRTMVSRSLDRIFRDQKPTELDRILMVTFTESAAAEMKERIGKLLHERLSTHSSHRVSEQIALLDSAKIGTLHSFAFGLIREHAHELGLSSGLKVLSNEESFRLSQTALSEVLQSHYQGLDDDSKGICTHIRQFGQGRDGTIRSLIRKIDLFAQSIQNPSKWLDKQHFHYSSASPFIWQKWLDNALPSWFENACDQIHKHSFDCENLIKCASSIKKAKIEFEKGSFENPDHHDHHKVHNDHSDLFDLFENSDHHDLFQKFEDRFQRIASYLQEAIDADHHWKRGTKTKVRPHFKTLFEDLEFLISNLPSPSETAPVLEDWERARPLILSLLRLTKDFGNEYRRLKRQQEGVDFQDIEQLALQLLYRDGREISDLAKEIRCRFDYVFVDEYQDINGAQDAIIKALSREKADANLFIVGDIKQSIYRFRRGNPKILSKYEGTWTGKKVYLQTNFRSHPKLLKFVNDFFAHLSKMIHGFEYGTKARLEAGLKGESSPSFHKGKVALHLICKDEISQSESPLEAQAHLIAQQLLDYFENAKDHTENAKVHNDHKDHTDHINHTDHFENSKVHTENPKVHNDHWLWSKVAILLRSVNDRSQIFARILSQYGIPVQAAAETFFDFPEVSDLLSLLKIIDNPLQNIPLLAFLRSPFCDLNVNELALIRLAASDDFFWKALEKFPEMKQDISFRLTSNGAFETEDAEKIVAQCSKKCERIISQRRGWLIDQRASSIADQIEKILRSSFYVERFSALHPSRSPEIHIRQFIELAREFEQQSNSSLTQFLQWIDQLQASEDAESIIKPVSEEGKNAVQLMSIHKSKGLEFPIVVLANLEKSFNQTDLFQPLIIDEDYGLCPMISLPDTAETYPSIPFWLSKKKHRIELIEEEARLLYVSMTRAKDHLLLVGIGTKKQIEEKWNAETNSELSRSNHQASCYLDWIVPWMFQNFSPKKTSESSEIKMKIHNSLLTKFPEYHKEAPLSNSSHPPHDYDHDHDHFNKRLEWIYPHLDSTLQQSKSSLSSLKKRLDKTPSMFFEDELHLTKSIHESREKGIAYHHVLQFMKIASGTRVPDFQEELLRLISEKRLDKAEIKEIDPNLIVAFWNSEVGVIIASQSENLHRELPFTARFSADELCEIGFETADLRSSNEPILIQGVIDFAVIMSSEIWLLDFKTDAVNASFSAKRAEHHRAQLTLYGKALERIYGRPITRSWVHFIIPNVSIKLI